MGPSAEFNTTSLHSGRKSWMPRSAHHRYGVKFTAMKRVVCWNNVVIRHQYNTACVFGPYRCGVMLPHRFSTLWAVPGVASSPWLPITNFTTTVSGTGHPMIHSRVSWRVYMAFLYHPDHSHSKKSIYNYYRARFIFMLSLWNAATVYENTKTWTTRMTRIYV